MADAKQEADWWRTAHVLCMMANVNRDPKKSKAFKPADFHPAAAKESGIRITRHNISVLKSLVTDRTR